MEKNNSAIPAELVGKWGYYVGHNPVELIRIGNDGSGNLSTSNDGKWSVNGNRLEFLRLKSYDPPVSCSVQYSIIGGKLHLSDPIGGDLFNDIILSNGLDKIN
jgi:hypothetical protein